MSTSSSAAEKDHATRVRSMFANISARYDLLNHLLSASLDKQWRRKVARQVQSTVNSDGFVLDVACGTGDLAFTLLEATGAQVIGTDFCRPMLEVAQRKGAKQNRRVPFIEGDALQLPFANDSFDAVTIAFGLRNLASFESGLQELLRVVKPGGNVLVLECSKPTMPGFRQLYEFYFHRVLPVLGGIVSGSKSAYAYLPDSVRRFPDQKGLASMMRAVGFDSVEFSNLTGGVAAIHCGTKPR